VSVKLGDPAAEIAKLDGVGGESQPAVVALECFPIAAHATQQVGAGGMIKMIRIEFAGRAQAIDQR
jgi:hypothetical protein